MPAQNYCVYVKSPKTGAWTYYGESTSMADVRDMQIALAEKGAYSCFSTGYIDARKIRG